MTIFFENAPILESLRDGLLLAKQVAGVEVGLVLAHLGIRRIRRVRSRQSLRERVWLPGKSESFNIHVKKNFVSHDQPVEKGKLQYYYLEHVAREIPQY